MEQFVALLCCFRTSGSSELCGQRGRDDSAAAYRMLLSARRGRQSECERRTTASLPLFPELKCAAVWIESVQRLTTTALATKQKYSRYFYTKQQAEVIRLTTSVSSLATPL